MTLKTNLKNFQTMAREYTNREQSGTVYDSRKRSKTEMEAVKERVMMIAQRLVAAEKEIEALKAKVK